MKYSEAFKLQVVRELEEGKYRSGHEVARMYGIGSRGTVSAWIRKYGRNHLLRKVVRVERPEERDQMKVLERRVRELEKALADAHMDGRLDRAYLELACAAAGIKDVEGFKKKHADRR